MTETFSQRQKQWLQWTLLSLQWKHFFLCGKNIIATAITFLWAQKTFLHGRNLGNLIAAVKTFSTAEKCSSRQKHYCTKNDEIKIMMSSMACTCRPPYTMKSDHHIQNFIESMAHWVLHIFKDVERAAAAYNFWHVWYSYRMTDTLLCSKARLPLPLINTNSLSINWILCINRPEVGPNCMISDWSNSETNALEHQTSRSQIVRVNLMLVRPKLLLKWCWNQWKQKRYW